MESADRPFCIPTERAVIPARAPLPLADDDVGPRAGGRDGARLPRPGGVLPDRGHVATAA